MSLPDPTRWPVGKVGYVAIVGRPNVGKSTLLNQILGEHLVAVSALPQTTRRHWRGILTEAASQAVFIDTPGAHIGKTQLNRAMLAAVMQSLDDADIVLCMADASRPPGDEDALVAERVAGTAKPTLLAINKIDAAEEAAVEQTREFFLERLPAPTPVHRLVARTGDGVPELVAALREGLPTGPFFYPPDQAIDAIERDIGAEIIREAALELLRDEVPHALAVEITQWKRDPKKLRIQANVFVERPTQKGIVLGKGGSMIQRIRQGAERQLAAWQDCRISLSLFVSVAKDWRNRPSFLRQHGLME